MTFKAAAISYNTVTSSAFNNGSLTHDQIHRQGHQKNMHRVAWGEAKRNKCDQKSGQNDAGWRRKKQIWEGKNSWFGEMIVSIKTENEHWMLVWYTYEMKTVSRSYRASGKRAERYRQEKQWTLSSPSSLNEKANHSFAEGGRYGDLRGPEDLHTIKHMVALFGLSKITGHNQI